MDVERLMRIGNVLASEKDRAEAIRYLAMNVCVDCLPTIVYISKLNSELKFEHFLSFGVSRIVGSHPDFGCRLNSRI